MAVNPEFPSITWAGPASSGRSRAGLGPMRYVTWHATANPTSNAQGEASYARSRGDGVGTHAVADALVCLQTQVTSLYVGHVGSSTGNRYGVAIECCGVNTDSAAHWRPIIDRCVPFVRAVMAKHGIANRWLTVEQMRDGRSTGHITHDMARLAWGGTDHTDPGPNFPKDYVISAVAGTTAVEDDMAFFDDPNAKELAYRVDAIFADRPATVGGSYVGKPEGVNKTHNRLDAIDAALTEVRALVKSGGVDPAAVAALVVAQLGPALDKLVEDKIRAVINSTRLSTPTPTS